MRKCIVLSTVVELFSRSPALVFCPYQGRNVVSYLSANTAMSSSALRCWLILKTETPPWYPRVSFELCPGPSQSFWLFKCILSLAGRSFNNTGVIELPGKLRSCSKRWIRGRQTKPANNNNSHKFDKEVSILCLSNNQCATPPNSPNWARNRFFFYLKTTVTTIWAQERKRLQLHSSLRQKWANRAMLIERTQNSTMVMQIYDN